MAQTVSYKVICPVAVQEAKYSTLHTAGINRMLLISCTGGSSASTTGMTLDLSADIKGTVHWVGGTFGTGGNTAAIHNRVRYSSASGSASTGKVLAWSSTTTIVYSKNGQDLSSLKWRWLVLHS